jgi:hypothetical protein
MVMRTLMDADLRPWTKALEQKSAKAAKLLRGGSFDSRLCEARVKSNSQGEAKRNVKNTWRSWRSWRCSVISREIWGVFRPPPGRQVAVWKRTRKPQESELRFQSSDFRD